jgi:hypothetical protein
VTTAYLYSEQFRKHYFNLLPYDFVHLRVSRTYSNACKVGFYRFITTLFTVQVMSKYVGTYGPVHLFVFYSGVKRHSQFGGPS